MQIDLEHLHYWMCAIRESKDPNRTLDAFWRGQISSKEWLIENLRPHIFLTPVSIDIHGGWVGTLASMLFQSGIPINNIRSVDLDPSCESIATTMNKKEEIEGRFCAVTSDMCAIQSDANVIINTSCEHITQDQYDLWISNVPYNSLLVLQSNNYNISEHIRIARNLDEFTTQCGDIKILWSGKLELPLYTRFMIIARPNQVFKI